MADMLIDVTRLVTRLIKRRAPTGIDRVCLAYVRRYGPLARATLRRGRFGVTLPKSTSNQLFSLLREWKGQSASGMADEVAEVVALPESVRGPVGSLLLNVGHSGPERPKYAEWLREKKLRPIFMVHDLIPVTHPEYCRPREQERHATRVENVLRTAAAVVTNSRVTLEVLSSYAADRQLPMPPALAAPLAGAELPTDERQRPLAEPYFVMLSTIEPRKNHWLILQVWRRLVEQFGASAPRLVVIGQRGWECENVLDLLDRSSVLRGFVFEKTGCSDTDLVNYLRHAQALLFPSFAEGYGLPLVEALSLGVPVIASELPVFREIAQDIPEYLDPLDGPAWLRCITSFCEPESELRSSQLLRMAAFSPPTWSAHFEQFENLLARVW
jgi:glycosyltransferase involved in cell wall biosynthesis